MKKSSDFSRSDLVSMFMRLGSVSLLMLDASESRFFFDTFFSFSFRRSRRLFKNPFTEGTYCLDQIHAPGSTYIDQPGHGSNDIQKQSTRSQRDSHSLSFALSFSYHLVLPLALGLFWLSLGFSFERFSKTSGKVYIVMPRKPDKSAVNESQSFRNVKKREPIRIQPETTPPQIERQSDQREEREPRRKRKFRVGGFSSRA